MPTYSFAEKNGSAVITLSAESEEEAIQYLEEITKYPKAFRLDLVEIDEEIEAKADLRRKYGE